VPIDNELTIYAFQPDRFNAYIREPLQNFEDWLQCAAVMRREAVTVMPIYSGGGDVVAAGASSL